VTVTLHAFLVRRPDLSHEEFLAYWRERHGPLIRDTPALARHLLRYEQHAALPGGRAGSDYDGVAVQVFASWDDFVAMLSEPEAELMREDEGNFLDSERLQILFSEDVVTVVGDPAGGH
jgi:uncharacterized protein (TIGR02118 family)